MTGIGNAKAAVNIQMSDKPTSNFTDTGLGVITAKQTSMLLSIKEKTTTVKHIIQGLPALYTKESTFYGGVSHLKMWVRFVFIFCFLITHNLAG